MTMKNVSNQKMQIINELIDNATELPTETLKILLLVANAMQCTRESIKKQEII